MASVTKIQGPQGEVLGLRIEAPSKSIKIDFHSQKGSEPIAKVYGDTVVVNLPSKYSISRNGSVTEVRFRNPVPAPAKPVEPLVEKNLVNSEVTATAQKTVDYIANYIAWAGLALVVSGCVGMWYTRATTAPVGQKNYPRIFSWISMIAGLGLIVFSRYRSAV